jgi:acetoin utilization protein AcuB
MRKAVVTVTVGDSMQEAIARMKEYYAPLLPVLKGDKLVGVVTDRDLKRASASDATTLSMHELAYLLAKVKVGDIMTKDPVTVAPDLTLEETAALLLEKNISGAPVVDNQGRIVGTISQREIFRALISLTGLEKRGVQFAFEIRDRGGTIKDLTDVVREHGGRLVSILTSYERAPAGFRNVYIRAFNIDREDLPKLKADLQAKARMLYMVDLRENVREEYPAPAAAGPECGEGALGGPTEGKSMKEEILDKAKAGNIKELRGLLSSGGDACAQDAMGWSALMWAAAMGHADAVKLLLENGATTEVKDQYGATALMKACRRGHADVAVLLLEHGADVDATDDAGWTSLMRAADCGSQRVAKALLEHDADTEAVNPYGWTALIIAATEGNAEVAEALLEKGADVHARDRNGWTAASWATSMRHKKVQEVLKQYEGKRPHAKKPQQAKSAKR